MVWFTVQIGMARVSVLKWECVRALDWHNNPTGKRSPEQNPINPKNGEHSMFGGHGE